MPSPDDRDIETRPWAFIAYLCGDNPKLFASTQKQVDAILGFAGSPHFHVAVQWDLPEGATRAALSGNTSWEREAIGKINTGDPDSFLDFLRWAFDRCPSEHVLVVASGTGLLDGRASIGGPDKDRTHLFTIANDATAGDALSLCEIGTLFRRAREASAHERIDILALDMRELQCLEVAYELEGSVDVYIAPQTRVPDSGWDFAAVLRACHDTFAAAVTADDEPPTVRQIARMVVRAVGNAYDVAAHGELSLSALDLHFLKPMASAFDTLSLAMVHSVGEDLIWAAREEVMRRLKSERPSNGAAGPGSAPGDDERLSEREYLYDLPEMLAELRRQFDAAGVNGLLSLISSHFGELDAAGLARALQSVDDACFTSGSRFRVAGLESSILDAKRARQLLRRVVRTAKAPDASQADRRLGLASDLNALFSDPLLRPENCASWLEGWPPEVVDALEPMLASAYRSAQRQQQRIRHLAVLTDRVLSMLAGPPAGADPDDPPGLIVEHFVRTPGGAVTGHGGVSLFRPRELDQLVESDYLDLRFNKKIHWTVLLAVINLIGHHPRALWRILSAVLATADNNTRAELLDRITGPGSVVAPFREQFVVLAPVKAFVLSLEPDPGAAALPVPVLRRAGDDKAVGPQAYRVRLELAERDPIIEEVVSIVDPNALGEVLRKLVALLEDHTTVGASDVAELESFGETIGEDVLQQLGVKLANEAATSKDRIHLQLQIPRELMAYPWELMHHKDGWLSEHFAVGRQVFSRTASGATRARVPGALRVLIIGNPVSEQRPLPYAALEAEVIAAGFEAVASETDGLVDFKRDRDVRINCEVTEADLRQMLRQGNYDILHYAGHATFEPNRPESSAWWLSDGPFSAQSIRNTLEWRKTRPWLVFANACEAGKDGTPRTYQTHVLGLASAFLDQGVSAYIAPLWRIDDVVAAEAAQVFYQQLLKERQTVGEALRRAKVNAKQKYYDRALGRPGETEGSDQRVAMVSWAGLVLYGNSTATVGQRLGAPPPPPAPVRPRERD